MRNKYVALMVIAAFVSVFAAPAFAAVYGPGVIPMGPVYDANGNQYQYNQAQGNYYSTANNTPLPSGSPVYSGGHAYYAPSNGGDSYEGNSDISGVTNVITSIIGGLQQQALDRKKAEYQQRLAEQERQNQEKLSQMKAEAEARRQQETMIIAKKLESLAQSDAISTARSCEQRGMSKTFSMIQDICTQNGWAHSTGVSSGMQYVMWSSTDTPPIVSVVAFEPKTHKIISTKGIPGITNDLMIFDVQQVNGKIKP